MKHYSERGNKTRAKMIQAALKLCHLQGINSTSVDNILQASHTGKSQFYHYFRNKNELLKYVIQEHAKNTLSLSKIESFEDLVRFFSTIDEFCIRDRDKILGCPIGRMVYEINESQAILRYEIGHFLERLKGHLVEGISFLKGQGKVDGQVDISILADFCIANIQGGMLLARFHQDIEVLRNTLKHCFNYIKYCTSVKCNSEFDAGTVIDQ